MTRHEELVRDLAVDGSITVWDASANPARVWLEGEVEFRTNLSDPNYEHDDESPICPPDAGLFAVKDYRVTFTNIVVTDRVSGATASPPLAEYSYAVPAEFWLESDAQFGARCGAEDDYGGLHCDAGRYPVQQSASRPVTADLHSGLRGLG